MGIGFTRNQLAMGAQHCLEAAYCLRDLITWPAHTAQGLVFVCIAALFCPVLSLGPPAGCRACFGVQTLYPLKRAAHCLVQLLALARVELLRLAL